MSRPIKEINMLKKISMALLSTAMTSSLAVWGESKPAVKASASTNNPKKNIGEIVISGEVDNAKGELKRFELIGDWSSPGRWISPSPGAKAVWRPNITEPGKYAVQLKYVDDPNGDHATDARFSVTHAGGKSSFEINLKNNVEIYNLLGIFSFKSGWDGFVELDAAKANGNLVADVVRFLPAPEFPMQENAPAKWMMAEKGCVTNGLELSETPTGGELPLTKWGGKTAWKIDPGKTADKNIFVRITDKAFKNEATSPLEIVIEYYDEGRSSCSFRFETYADKGGTVSQETNIALQNSKTWKLFRSTMKRVYFGGQLKGNDFLIIPTKSTPLVIAAVALIKK